MISPWFILGSAFNTAWIVAFSYERLGISTLLIIGMLFFIARHYQGNLHASI